MAHLEPATNVLASLIRTLGGPIYAPQDFEWATILPAGKALIEWLAAQAQIPGLSEEEENAIEHYQASLDSIALHAEEVQEEGIAGCRPSGDHSGIPALPLDFVPLSTLRARSRCTQQEIELVESETQLLKHRLKSAKVASKQLAQTINALHVSINEIDDDIHRQEETLGEISIKADTIIAQSTNVASKLLQSMTSDDISAFESRLAALVTLRSEIVASAERQFHTVNEARCSLPAASEVKQEGEILHSQLKSLSHCPGVGPKPRDSSHSLIGTKSYCAELVKLSRRLKAAPDDGSKRQVLGAILGEADIDESDDESNVDGHEIDVAEELTRAWHLDQMTLLTARERILDETTQLFTQRLMPPLDELQNNLATLNGHAFDAEALVSALIEETEEVADDVAGARASGSKIEMDNEPQALLEAELTELLKGMQNARSPDAGPLVLLDRADLVKEIQSIPQRLRNAEIREMEWASTLSGQLSVLLSSHRPILSTVYANSPVNTSPPLSLPVDTQALERQALQEVEQLNTSIAKLEKTQLSGRDVRGLNRFVEKWVRS